MKFKVSFSPRTRAVLAAAVAVATIGVAGNAFAQQTFTALIDGKTWESDNDGINVVPEGDGNRTGTVTITAITKGFSAYPPPKGYSDNLTIVCPKPKKPERFLTTGMAQSKCRVSFTKAGRNMMSPDYAKIKNEGEYTASGAAGDKGYVNFTKVAGKMIEGEFSTELVEITSKKRISVSGKFSGLDQQMGSIGFN